MSGPRIVVVVIAVRDSVTLIRKVHPQACGERNQYAEKTARMGIALTTEPNWLARTRGNPMASRSCSRWMLPAYS